MMSVSISSVFKLSLAAVLLAFLVGCASAPSGRTALPASDLASKKVDHERIARIEHAARQSGAKVVWVNPPRKRDE
jgi:hypothetical protein